MVGRVGIPAVTSTLSEVVERSGEIDTTLVYLIDNIQISSTLL